MSGGSTVASSVTRIEALQVQSSTYGATLSLVYGMARVPGNLIWYGGFNAVPNSSPNSGGKGGGAQTQSTSYEYYASVMMGLCEGPITGIQTIWKGSNVFNGGNSNTGIVVAQETYNVAQGGSNYTVTNWANFVNPISVALWNGQSGANQEYWPLAEGVDFTDVGGVYRFPPTSMASIAGGEVIITYSWQSDTITNNGLQQLGMTAFTGAIGQEPWTTLTTSFSNQALGYSGVAYVAAGNYDLGTGAQVDNHTFEVIGRMAYSVGANLPDANPKDITFDVLTNDRYGAACPSSMFGDLTNWGNYCLASGILLSPSLTTQQTAASFVDMMSQVTNSGPVWSGGKLNFVPYGDANLSGQGLTLGLSYSWTTNNVAEYDLGDDDFVNPQDPIKVTRKQQSDCYNSVKIEYLERNNSYNVQIMEAKDQASIDQYGLREMSAISCHWICDAQVAQIVAQLILQRSIYVRNTYTFKLPWTFAFLDPMDLVTLNDSALGFTQLPVRITQISEDKDGVLEFEAEDFTLGAASMIAYPRQGASGFQPNYNVDPGNALAPVIFEMPGSLTTTGLEMGIATAGNSPNWGGADVWASYDGNTYVFLGRIIGGSRYGTLLAPMSSGWADVHINSGQLLGSTGNGPLGTLCYVGGASQEFFAYETATLTGNGTYRLNSLARGAYETEVVVHNANDPFVRVDDSIAVSSALDKSLIGQTVYVKLCSFNVYGAALQSLADVEPYDYVVTGVFVNSKPGINSYFQETPPTSPSIGDLWTIPSTGETYRWNGTSWDLQGTVGANASTFTGTIGLTNLLQYSSFRDSTAANGVADGWVIVDNEGGNNPVTPTWNVAAGLYDGGAQTITWNNPNKTFKGLRSDANVGGVSGGWIPNANYVVSGFAKVGISNVGDEITLMFDVPPLSVEWAAEPAMYQSWLRFAARVSWGSSVPPNGQITVATSNMHLTGGGSVTFTSLQVTQGDVLTEFSESAADIRRAAQDAQNSADSAANMAQIALDGIGATVSDNLIVPSEKRALVIDYNAAIDEQIGIDNEAISFGVDHSTYDAAIVALTNYLATCNSPTLWSDTSGSTVVVGTTFLAQWTNYYTTRQTLLNAISTAAKALANAAQSSANTALTAANSAAYNAAQANISAQYASDTANAASANANSALAAIGVAASDNTLVPSEKRAIIVDYNSIINEQPGYDQTAIVYGLTSDQSNYDNAVANLTSYLGTLTTPTAWNNISGSTTIVGATFVQKFSQVYATRQTLLNDAANIAHIISTNANAAANSANAIANAANAVAAQAFANAAAAGANAATAIAQLGAIASDNVLTPQEKQPVINDYNVVIKEVSGILTQAYSYGLDTGGPGPYTDYLNAYTNLTNYMSSLLPGWTDLTVNTNIDGPTFDTYWQTYYTTRQTLLLAIAAIAGTRAAWANVSNVVVTTPQIGANQVSMAVNATGLVGANLSLGNVGSWDTGTQTITTFTSTGKSTKLLMTVRGAAVVGGASNAKYCQLTAYVFVDGVAVYGLTQNFEFYQTVSGPLAATWVFPALSRTILSAGSRTIQARVLATYFAADGSNANPGGFTTVYNYADMIIEEIKV